MEFFYNGVWRMDWGFENPNKTSAAVAMLMVAVWSLALVRRYGFPVALVLFTGLGLCLAHTFSRGGIFAAVVALALVAWYLPRTWPRKRVGAVMVACAVIVGFAVHLQAHQRLGQGLDGGDRSVTNRLDLWSAAPAMVRASPDGWGLGNSGDAYMQWYQPLDRTERYRTMVNSHLTWLVEFPWRGRLLYVAGWGTVLLLSWPAAGRRWFILVFGIWVAFGLSAVFSSVAEEPLLWVLPLFGLLAVLAARLRHKEWPRPVAWGAPPALAAVVVGLLSIPWSDGTPLRAGPGWVVWGNGQLETWVIVDRATLGNQYGRTFRAHLETDGVPDAVGMVEVLDVLPSDVWGGRIIVTGLPSEFQAGSLDPFLDGSGETILVNPGWHPAEMEGAPWLDEARVVFGEFCQSPAVASWRAHAEVKALPGVGDFIPAWPGTLFETQNQ